MIETIKKLVAIPSVTGAAPEPGKPYGPYVYEALETALGICEGLGFRTKLDDEGYYGYAEIGAGEELMGILVHLDGAPAGPTILTAARSRMASSSAAVSSTTKARRWR